MTILSDVVEVIEGAVEPWEEIQCQECGAILRFHPLKAMSKCEYIYRGTKRINEYIDCPKCSCMVLRYLDN